MSRYSVFRVDGKIHACCLIDPKYLVGGRLYSYHSCLAEMLRFNNQKIPASKSVGGEV